MILVCSFSKKKNCVNFFVGQTKLKIPASFSNVFVRVIFFVFARILTKHVHGAAEFHSVVLTKLKS